jgi:hypothetical protein
MMSGALMRRIYMALASAATLVAAVYALAAPYHEPN